MKRRLHIPNTITEFDDQMLVPLTDNFVAIQKHVSRAEADIAALAEGFQLYVNETNQALIEINETLEAILEELSTESTST